MRKYYKYIILFEILLLIIVVLIGKNYKNKEVKTNETEGEEVVVEEMNSIFSILPYEEESICVYYYPDSGVLEIQINSSPYDINVEYALSILHKYKETKDYTASDVRIVTPSFMMNE